MRASSLYWILVALGRDGYGCGGYGVVGVY